MSLVSVLTGVIIALAVLNGLLYLAKPHMVFMPLPDVDANPNDWGFEYEDLFIETTDGVHLNVWYIPAEGAERTLLFFHGNGGNLSHRRESIAVFNRLGFNVLIVDYRGYGRSEGKPSEVGIYLDGQAAWRYLTEVRGLDPTAIVVFGRSLGGAVAARLAATVRPAGVIIEASFTSIRDVARARYSFLSYLVVLRYRFDVAKDISSANSPVLVLHSKEDEIIPFFLGARLYASAPEPKRFVTLNGTHNKGFLTSQPAYETALAAFVRTLAIHGEMSESSISHAAKQSCPDCDSDPGIDPQGDGDSRVSPALETPR